MRFDVDQLTADVDKTLTSYKEQQSDHFKEVNKRIVEIMRDGPSIRPYEGKMITIPTMLVGDLVMPWTDLAADMCYKMEYVGVTARQLGLPFKVIVLKDFPTYQVFIHPVITRYNGKPRYLSELSIEHPESVYIEKRYSSIDMSFTDSAGTRKQYTFNGKRARHIQHLYSVMLTSGFPRVCKPNRITRTQQEIM